MSIETDARQEAERRWPALNPGDVELTYPRGALRATARKAFEAGAVWASEQTDREPSADRARVSDGAVQRVREAIYAQTGHYPTITAAIEILSAALDGEQDTREPSDAEVRDVLYFALRDAGEGRTVAEKLSRRLSAALLAAREVRNRG